MPRCHQHQRAAPQGLLAAPSIRCRYCRIRRQQRLGTSVCQHRPQARVARMLPLGCHSTLRVLRPYGRTLPMLPQAVKRCQPTASGAARETSSSTIGGSTTTPTAGAALRAHDRETGTATAIDETRSAQGNAIGGSTTAPTASAAIRAHDRETTGIATATAGGGGIDRGPDRETPTAVAAQLGLPLGRVDRQMSNPELQGRRPTSVTRSVTNLRYSGRR